MNWQRVKLAKEVALEGVAVETDRSDKGLVSVTFTDKNGSRLRVRIDSYTMLIEIPEPPKMVEKVAVTGEVVGVKVSETFDSKYDADNRKREIENAGGAAEVATVQVPDDIPF